MNQLEMFTQQPINSSTLTRIKGILFAMARMGASSELLRILLEFADINLSPEQRRYLVGPILTHQSPWAADTPRWMLEAVTAARLDKILSELLEQKKDGLATTLEVAIILQAVSMEAPMTTAWANVYLWSAREAYLKYHLSQTTNQEAVLTSFDRLQIKALSSDERQQYYNQLAIDIRKKIVQSQQAREPSPTQEANPKKAPLPRRSNAITVEQTTLL